MNVLAVLALLPVACATASSYRWSGGECAKGGSAGDCTTALQAFLDRKEDTLKLGPRPEGYPTRPLFLKRSRVTVVFLPGVEIKALEGGFPGQEDCLLDLTGLDSVSMEGAGARLSMRKGEYRSGEWRHAIQLRGCRAVRIQGLAIDSSGGDGIYIGSWKAGGRTASEDILVRDCVLRGHRRQGISVISANRLRLERLVLQGTAGTAPECGLDFEPNESRERLTDCIVSECAFIGNANHGAMAWIGHLDSGSEPVSILFERCRFESSRKGSGFHLGGFRDPSVRGGILLRDCAFAGNPGSGVDVSDLPAAGPFRMRLDSCRISGTATAAITLSRDEAKGRLGGLIARGLELDDGLRARVLRVLPAGESAQGVEISLAWPRPDAQRIRGNPDR